jgi:hypothetical protein
MSSKSYLLQKAQRLQELPELIIESALGEKYEEINALFKEYRNVKKEIKLAFLDKPAEMIPDLENQEHRRILQDVLLGKKLPFESKMQGTIFEKMLDDDLDDRELGGYADDYFSRGYAYVDGLYRVGALIVGIGSLPDNLTAFLYEMRECYAFEQYRAVCSLCRTVLELSIKDIYLLEGFEDEDSDVHQIAEHYFDEKYKDKTYKTVENYNISLSDARNVICKLPEFKGFYWRIRNLQEELNRVVHGRTALDRRETEEVVKETLEIVHELYET